MRTLRTNTWIKLNEKQKASALLWTKQATARKIIPAAASIAVFFVLYAGYAISRIVNGKSVIGDRSSNILLLMLVVIVLFCLSLILTEIRKIIAIRSDKAMITDVVIVSKEIRRGHRNSIFYYVKVNGLFEDNKPVEKDISISKNLYSVVNAKEKGYAIRFDPADNGKLPDNIGYIPK